MPTATVWIIPIVSHSAAYSEPRVESTAVIRHVLLNCKDKSEGPYARREAVNVLLSAAKRIVDLPSKPSLTMRLCIGNTATATTGRPRRGRREVVSAKEWCCYVKPDTFPEKIKSVEFKLPLSFKNRRTLVTKVDEKGHFSIERQGWQEVSKVGTEIN